MKTNVHFGAGVLDEVPRYLEQEGAQRIALVVDAGVVDNPYWKKLVNSLSKFRIVETVQCTVAEPDYDYLDEARKPLEGKEIDCFVAAGGGSALDLAKALSVLITNPGPAISYRGFNLVKNPGPPLVAIPTTAGTGSEVTPNAVFTDRREMRKLGINTELYVPRLAVLDPRITLSCPRSVTISSGVDALVHSVESFVAQKASPVSRMWSRQGFSLVFNTLDKVVKEPDSIEYRGRMQVGAYAAGTGLMNSGAGPAGALSYPLGVHFRVPHGVAGGVFLAHVARLNVERGCELYGDLYDLMDGARAGLSPREKSVAFCDQLEALLRKLEVPQMLRTFGVSSNDVALLTEKTMLLKGALDMNPVPFAERETRELLKRIV